MSMLAEAVHPDPSTPKSVAIGPGDVTATFVYVTPELAKSWLAVNIENNRPLKPRKIAGYARDLANGKWILTGESIKFDVDGSMVDGQNRCEAIVQSGVGAWMLVVQNLPHEAAGVLDSGSARSSADMLTITGLAEKSSAKDVAAIARLYTLWRGGQIQHAGSHVGGGIMTKAEMAEAVESIPGLDFAARHAKGVYRYLRIPTSAIGVAFLEFHKIDLDDTAEFFNRIRDGIQEGPGDPFTSLSRRVTMDLQAGASHRILPAAGLYYLFRTWNAWRDNEQISRFVSGSAASGWTSVPAPH